MTNRREADLQQAIVDESLHMEWSMMRKVGRKAGEEDCCPLCWGIKPNHNAYCKWGLALGLLRAAKSSQQASEED